MTGTEIQLAPLYDGYDPATGPYFAPDRSRIDDPAQRRRVAAYLRGGVIVARSFTLDRDVLDPSRGDAVPGSFRTDGSWLWSDGLMYYVEEHGVAPTTDFYAHIAASGYRCPDPDEASVRRAGDALEQARR
jgi:hypothetical protein